MPNKFVDRNPNLHWGRYERDGAPYRGSALPLVREEEAETLLETSVDFKYGTFDTATPEQREFGETLQEVLEAVGAGWYQLKVWNERWHDTPQGPKMYVFVVWVIPHKELVKSSAFGHNFLHSGGRS